MPNYSKQGGGSRFGGGRPSFGGGARGVKPSFGGKKPWEQSRDKREGGPVTLHKASCAKCSKECEVPFRPVEGRPVYCKDCFDRGGNASGERFPKPGRFEKRPFASRPAAPSFSKPSDDGVKRELEQVNAKLDRLIGIMEKLTQKEALTEAVATLSKKAAKPTAKKKSAKK